jgi:methylenetetrahydrofolate dehydrogenase (NADP+)/methenyltetrahydrofolate cyclohydrolase/formyltetrahydrofolate synthetase
MQRRIENARKFGVSVVVAINKYSTDTDLEIKTVKHLAITAGAYDAVLATHWSDGGKGAVELGKSVISASFQPQLQILISNFFILKICQLLKN